MVFIQVEGPTVKLNRDFDYNFVFCNSRRHTMVVIVDVLKCTDERNAALELKISLLGCRT